MQYPEVLGHPCGYTSFSGRSTAADDPDRDAIHGRSHNLPCHPRRPLPKGAVLSEQRGGKEQVHPRGARADVCNRARVGSRSVDGDCGRPRSVRRAAEVRDLRR